MIRILFLSVLLAVMLPAVQAQQAASSNGKVIVMETSLGNIELLLYDDTPLHRDNMIKLIKNGYYDGQLFHRVINNFMIQGGDPHSKGAEKGQRLGTGGPGYTIEAEIREQYFHKKGALAAARQGDAVNPEKRSSGSQFYIVQGQVLNEAQLATLQTREVHDPFTPEEIETYTTIGGTPHLDDGYTVFGEVIRGLDVVDAIAVMPTDNNARPLDDIIFSIRLK
ncbi:MAG: peptidylprolyl isomerase [Bacteroidales bacterium]|nr:peptidylprolyl isomerase [Bacteroidales bacterium]MDT8431177.1 peptidylprolyl isomerase [Bacteroidales bacterium]